MKQITVYNCPICRSEKVSPYITSEEEKSFICLSCKYLWVKEEDDKKYKKRKRI